MKRILPLCLLLVSTTAFAQEFGRASGGDLSMVTKGPSMFSGSLSASWGFGSGRGYAGTAGGTLLKDRMWFFGTAEKLQPTRISLGNAIGATLNTQVGDRNAFGASIRQTNIPSNFLSLRYTGMISPSSYVTVSASQSK